MAVEGLGRIVGEHALFKGLGREFLDLVAGCAKNVRFPEGAYLYHEGDSADEVFLIREGQVTMEISAPGQGSMVVQTMGPNELVGLSWIVPPYRWAYDARAATDLRAISLDATCLRGKCDADPGLGYEVMKRIAPIIVERLHATRMQMLDLYGERS
jgi:CRP/FNR family cyclic AMP-dependent transcriptional regulator